MRGPRIDRRTFLRGVGTGLALPLLEAMLPEAAAAAAPPVRLVFLFAPNGKHMPDWTPSTEGQGFDLPPLLEPLAPFRDRLLVFSGLGLDGAAAHGDGPGDHARAAASFLTGAHPVKTDGADIRAGVSVDQVAAAKLGEATPFASLELGLEGGARAGRCDSGYSCAYVSTISWRTPTTPNAKEVVPRRVFERLLGRDRRLSPEERARRGRLRASVLDLVLEDATRLAAGLGGADRRRLDEYLTGVRELEVRLDEAERAPPVEAPEVPAGVPADPGEHLRLMADLVALALRTDRTRVVTLMLGNAGSNRTYRELGVRDGHHHLSHHGGDPEKLEQITRINRFHVEGLAYLVGKLAAVQEEAGSLLDRSLVLYGSGIRDGNRHDHHDLPILLLGGGGGAVRAGRHLRLPARTPLCNLYASLLDAAGVRVAAFGDSTGRVDLAG